MSEIQRLEQENAELKRQLEIRRRQDEFKYSSISFNEKEAHCLARLLQGAVYGKNFLDGCSFCKFQCKLVKRGRDEKTFYPETTRWRNILDKLTKVTGVDCGMFENCNLYNSDFPYKRFLKNANDEAKEYFKNYFSEQ